jgi:hypothetical protein
VVSSRGRANEGRPGSVKPEISDGGIHASELLRATWRKSTYSTYNGACVGFAVLRDDLVAIRDTKDVDPSRAIVLSKAAWNAFLADLKSGEPGH